MGMFKLRQLWVNENYYDSKRKKTKQDAIFVYIFLLQSLN